MLRGFSLLELMITIAVAGIALGIVVPGLQQFIQNNRQTSQLNLLAATLATARSEAVKQNTRVVICPSATGTACAAAGSGWQTGWIAFADRNADLAYSDNTSGCNEGATTADCLILRQNALSGSNVLTGASGIPALIGYDGTGAVFCDADQNQSPESCVTANTYLTLCDSRGAAYARALAISATGRTSLLDKTPTGAALTCP